MKSKKNSRRRVADHHRVGVTAAEHLVGQAQVLVDVLHGRTMFHAGRGKAFRRPEGPLFNLCRFSFKALANWLITLALSTTRAATRGGRFRPWKKSTTNSSGPSITITPVPEDALRHAVRQAVPTGCVEPAG